MDFSNYTTACVDFYQKRRYNVLGFLFKQVKMKEDMLPSGS